jgi:hypothetical protein
VEKRYGEELTLVAEYEWAELWHLGVWENRNACRVLVGRLQGTYSLKDMSIVGRIILKGILNNRLGWRGVNLSGSVDSPLAGSCG